MDPQSPSQPINVPVQPPPKPFPTVSLILSILILLLLSLTTYLSYQNMQLTRQIAALQVKTSPTPTPTPANLPNTAPTPTIPANWKTYTNAKYGFSFKYPTTWEIMNLGSTYKKVVLLFDLQKEDPRFANCHSEGPCENFAHIQFNAGTTDSNTKDFDFDFWGNGYPIAKMIKTMVNGTTVVQAFNTNQSPFPMGSLYKIRSNLQIDATAELFNYNDGSNKTQYSKETIQEINQILSTFTFLDQPKPTTSTTTYTCPSNGYVDCMPVMDAAKQKACSPEAMTWYKANCPNFKGAAM